MAEVLLDELVRPDLDAVFAASRRPGSAASRLDAVMRADHALVVKHEAAFRTALRAMLVAGTDDPSDVPRRAGNRLRYFAEALAPVQESLGAERLERVVAVLSMCAGIESLIVAEDICGLRPAVAEAVKRWAARVLLQAALAEAEGEGRAHAPP